MANESAPEVRTTYDNGAALSPIDESNLILAQIASNTKGGINQTIPGTTNGVAVLTQKGAANLNIVRQTSTGTAATLLIARATRRSVLITNLETDTAKIAYVGPATVTTSNGTPIYAGQSVPFTWVGLLQVIDDTTNHAALACADEYD